MRKRTKFTLSAVVCVLVTGGAAVAGPIIYRDFFAAPPADAPTLMASEGALRADASPEPLDPAILSGEWHITDGSEAGYRVNERLNGVEVTVTGRTPEVTGLAELDGLTVVSARFSVDIASIVTDSAQRDSYFRDQTMRAGEFPTATFELTTPTTADAAPLLGETVEQEFSGDLTLAGVTQRVDFIAQTRTNGATAEIAGQIPVDFADYGIDAPDLGFVSVADQGFVEFQIVLEQP